ncbi:MAG: phosphoribosylanthranilate isomerase [Flavobacteriaceae bacterium]|nr:phosphoribosylanthranilate isomerase [Flavobacteriaceae bacterium]
MKLKICGIKYPENIKQVAILQPDYLGFIFYEKSKRNLKEEIPEISEKIKKTGVFVNATIDFILEKVKKYQLKAVQLHGDESIDFCQNLLKTINNSAKAKKEKDVELFKVFSVGETFDFSLIKAYENVCDFFLFDTKGKERGGNGVVFNWELLKEYPSTKPYFLSGGIGLESVLDLKNFIKSDASKYCYAIDVNSKFEIKPGLKDIEKLIKFKQNLKLG